jgi:phospholipid/cholesterol/gamma-HCH transport system substrate-binding protein
MHSYTLMAKSGEDITVGMPVVFSGFAIGRVTDMELSDSGAVLITVKIPEKRSKWLRENSMFVINKPLIGAARLVVSTPDLKSPPLSDETIPEVTTVGDVNEVMRRITPILDYVIRIAANVETITAKISQPEGEVNLILRDVKEMTGRMAKKQSLLEMAVDDQESVAAVQAALRNTKEITAKLDRVLKTAESVAVKTENGVYGPEGVLPLVMQILKDLLAKLRTLDVTVQNVNKISTEAADAAVDLKSLRTDLDATVNAIEKLVDDIERVILLKKAPEIKLP